MAGDTISIDQFATEGGRTEELLAYPYTQPTCSYLTDGEVLTALPDNFADFVEAADDMLLSRSLPGMAERVPVLEYGANTNPVKYAEKMGKYANPDNRYDLQVTPKISGVIPGVEVVWHGRPGQRGSTFAELYRDADTAEATAACSVAFMNPLQLASLHITEGETYQPVRLEALAGDNDHQLRALAYGALNSTVLLKQGRPVPVQRPGTPTTLGAMTAEQAVDYMIQRVQEHGEPLKFNSARELINHLAGKELPVRKAVQGMIGNALLAKGVSQEYAFPLDAAEVVGRADFNMFHAPHYEVLQIMEVALAPIRPSARTFDQEMHKLIATQHLTPEEALPKVRARLDVTHKIRQQANKQLKARLAGETIAK